MTDAEIVKEIRRRCKLFGVKFLASNKKMVDLGGGILCSGYFDPANKVLAYSTKGQHSIGTLLHEYCHVTQWVQNCTAWRIDTYWGAKASIDTWLTNKNYNPKYIKEAVNSARQLQADNERRTVRLIKELGADIDIQTYIKAANSYIYFYNTLLQERKWYRPDRTPYRATDILQIMPGDKILDSFEKTPPKIKKFLKTCV